jgi:hypothetical protein
MPILGIFSSAFTPGPSFLLVGSSEFGAFISNDAISWTHYNTQYLWDTTVTSTDINLFFIANSKLYAVDSDDTLYITTDGTTWTVDKWPSPSNSNTNQRALNYVNSNYVLALSGRNGIMFSTDEVTWQLSNEPTTVNPLGALNGVPVYGNSTYVSAGASASLWTSTDLISWTSRSLPLTGVSTDTGYITAFGNNRFAYTVVISGTEYVYSSTDGITWTDTTPAGITSTNERSLVYGNTLFLLAYNSTSIYTSTDSVTWTTRTTGATNNVTGVAVANNIYFALESGATDGGCTFLSSTNGTTWTRRTLLNAAAGVSNTVNDITYFNSKYYYGLASIVTATGTNLYSSTNFTTFTAVDKGGRAISLRDINDAVYANDKYTFVGASGYMIEANSTFTTWTTRTSQFGTTAINGITYGNSTYVAVGSAGQVRTSTNGTTWTTRTSTFGATNINDVAFGAGVFVAVGNAAQLRSSTDGITWTTRTSQFGTSAINTVDFVNNYFIASGINGRLSYSTDGTTWTGVSVGAVTKTSATYGAGVYLSAGNDNSFHTSTDLATWTTRTGPYAAATLDTAVVMFKNGVFIAKSTNSIVASGSRTFEIYYTSADAITWTSRTLNGSFGSGITISNGTVL